MNANKAGYVYFIIGEKTQLVKIGKAKDAWKRLAGLQVGSPDKLTMLLRTSLSTDVFALEHDFHTRFAKYRVHGEWFEFGAGIKQFIEDERKRAGVEKFPIYIHTPRTFNPTVYEKTPWYVRKAVAFPKLGSWIPESEVHDERAA